MRLCKCCLAYLGVHVLQVNILNFMFFPCAFYPFEACKEKVRFVLLMRLSQMMKYSRINWERVIMGGSLVRFRCEEGLRILKVHGTYFTGVSGGDGEE